jgi:hypothetical protein
VETTEKANSILKQFINKPQLRLIFFNASKLNKRPKDLNILNSRRIINGSIKNPFSFNSLRIYPN